MKTLVIDIGGSNVKLLATGKRTPLKLPSGPDFTPEQMMKVVLPATAGWTYESVSIGYPGPVRGNRPASEPVNLGEGWVRFEYESAFACPVRMINDAAMQALGSYDGGKMLFLGLGTGMGSALVHEEIVVPLELGHLPYRKGRTYEEYIGQAGLNRLGERKWRGHVEIILNLFLAALNADYAVLGGGNVRFFDEMPPRTRRGNNMHAFRGGYRLWQKRARLS